MAGQGLQASKPGSILVGINSDFPPFEYVDAMGNPKGYDVDLLRAVARTMDLDVRIEAGPFEVVRRDLEENHIRMLAGMMRSKERERYVDFSTAYLVIHYGIYVHEGSKAFQNLEALRNQSVIVENGAQMHEHLKTLGFAKELVPVKSTPEGLRLLASGAHDAVVVPLLIAARQIRDAQISEDVTLKRQIELDLLRSQASLAEAQHIAHLGSWEWDLEHDQVSWSEELYRVLNLEPQQALPSIRAMLRRSHPADRRQLLLLLRQAFAHGRSGALNHRILKSGDGVRYLHATIEARTDVAGRVLRLFGTSQDITERRNAEEALRQAQRLKGLGVLAGGIAHDFNNLLAAIMANLNGAAWGSRP